MYTEKLPTIIISQLNRMQVCLSKIKKNTNDKKLYEDYKELLDDLIIYCNDKNEKVSQFLSEYDYWILNLDIENLNMSIKADLDIETTRMLKEIQKRLNIDNNADVLRWIINYTYNKYNPLSEEHFKTTENYLEYY